MKPIMAIMAILALAALMIGCSEECASGMYDSQDKCCKSVCQPACENGVKEGSCGCECNQATGTTQESGVGDVFEDNGNVNPPGLPS